MAKKAAKKSVRKTAARKRSAVRKAYSKHTGHASHLCELVARRDMERVASLSKGAGYMCHICGRAAAKASSVCEPVAI